MAAGLTTKVSFGAGSPRSSSPSVAGDDRPLSVAAPSGVAAAE